MCQVARGRGRAGLRTLSPDRSGQALASPPLFLTAPLTLYFEVSSSLISFGYEGFSTSNLFLFPLILHIFLFCSPGELGSSHVLSTKPSAS